MSQQLQQIIDSAWEQRAEFSPAAAPKEVVEAVEHVLRHQFLISLHRSDGVLDRGDPPGASSPWRSA